LKAESFLFEKSEPVAEEEADWPAGSIIDLFRTLECRFPHKAPPCLALATLPLQVNATFDKHYKITSPVHVTINDLELIKRQRVQAMGEEDIDSLARQAIETESIPAEILDDESIA